MNPNRGESQINFELPREQPPTPEDDGQRPEQGQEAPPVRQEQVGKQAPVSLPVTQDIPAAEPTAIPAAQDDDLAFPSAPPQTDAQDSDHIEPIWINRAKDVIATTHNDPFKQKHEMSRVKAEYIQKRFNKTIKTDEPAA